jgi:two-component system, chemotaxis family, chemotaxis protein CheY
MSESLRNFTILLSGHDKHIDGLLRVLFREMGFGPVAAAVSAEESVEVLNNKAIDFLVVHSELTDMGMLGFISHIRHQAEKAYRRIPIIAVLETPNALSIRHAQKAGINEFIAKPFSVGAVFRTVERLIERPRPFIISEVFVGPCRRGRGADNHDDRRGKLTNNTAQTLLPDFSLMHKLGKNVALKQLIPAHTMEKAETQLAGMREQAIAQIMTTSDVLFRSNFAETYLTRSKSDLQSLAERSLEVSSRSGAFGYQPLVQVSYDLFLILGAHEAKPIFPKLAHKHAEVLHFLVNHDMGSGEGCAPLCEELRVINARYLQSR